MTGPADVITDAIHAHIRKYVDDLERMCEVMLVDEQRRGILVTQHGDGSYTIALSDTVPMMEIHHVHEYAGYIMEA